MSLLNAFIDSVVCVGFSSESGLTLNPPLDNSRSVLTSDLQSYILAVITADRAAYPPSRGEESLDSSYPPLNRLSSRNSLVLSTSSDRSTPLSLTAPARVQKQHILLAGYKDLNHYCFPDGIRATFQREKEKIHHFVLSQDGKRSYALALTFQQAFILETDKPDDEGVYQITDFQLAAQKNERSTVSKIPIAIDRQKTTPTSSGTSTPTNERHPRKMPSAYPGANAANRTRSTSNHNRDNQSARHYEVPTISSANKNVSTPVLSPPSRMTRTKSQDNVAPVNTTPTSSSSGMRKRTGSITPKPLPVINTNASSASSSSSSTSSSKTSTSTSNASVTAKPFYLPHCVVLISSEPYWTAMQETISIIYDEITRSNIEPYSKDYKKLIQRYAFLACNTPIPPTPWDRYSLSFNVTYDRFVITFDPPFDINRSILDLDLSILLFSLNIGKLLDVLAAIFTEQPIIFFSSNYSRLVTTLECLLYLIYPLKWDNIYVPLVPDGLRDVYLDGSPGLYLKGAHPRHQSIIEKFNVCLTCNLDNDKNIYVPDGIEFHHIPPTKMHGFIDPITQLLEEIKVACSLKNVPTAARLPMEQQRELERLQRFENNQKISKIFLALMIDIFGDALDPIYWKVHTQQISPTNTLKDSRKNRRHDSNPSQKITVAIPVFMKEKYLLSKREGIDLEFYNIFVETVAFQTFLKEEMMSKTLTEFTQTCQKRLLFKENQFYHFGDTPLKDNPHNQFESATGLSDSLSSQMLLPLPEWPIDLSIHYLDSCIEVFTDELDSAQEEERSAAAISVYAYLRGCARLARGYYLDGLRDLYLIENPNLFPQKYIETVIIPRLMEERLLDYFLNETFYTKSPEWKKVRTRALSHSMSVIDFGDSDELIDASPLPSTPDSDFGEWNVVEQPLTYHQFVEHIHRLNIVRDPKITEVLFNALSYWTNNPAGKSSKDSTLTGNATKPSEPNKPLSKQGSGPTNFTFQHTMDMLNNHARKGSSTTPIPTPTPKLPSQPERTLPIALFDSFVDIWQQTNAEKIRMNHLLPEDRQKQESILKVSTPGVVSGKEGPGQIILTQKRLYLLPESRSNVRLLTELANIISIDKFQHQTIFSSPKPSIKLYTSSTSSLPRENNSTLKSKSSVSDNDSKSSSIRLLFKNTDEQTLWYTVIMEIWSGLSIAQEQNDTAILNRASRHVALMDALSHIDYNEQVNPTTEKRTTNPRQKSKQYHNEASLAMALNDLSIFTQMRQSGAWKPLPPETRKFLTRRLSPSVYEVECHTVRCLVYTEHAELGRSSLWCAYGSKLKVFDGTTWIYDPNDLSFPSFITAMCLDGRDKLWIRCMGGQLFVVDTLTHLCETELKTSDGENACETIAYNPRCNHILTANRMGLITVWNASNWARLYDINLLEMYRKSNPTEVASSTDKNSSKAPKVSSRKGSFLGGFKRTPNPDEIPGLPTPVESVPIVPSANDKLDRIQIYEDLLFACYRNDYIMILRMTNSNTYTFEHIVSVEYKTDAAVLIDSFLVYNKQIWVATGCIISIFNVNNTNEDNRYNIFMKTPVDDDRVVTMLGFSGFVWAGSLKGKVYVFRMDTQELYKTFAGHYDSVYCLCPMLDMYVISGSGPQDTSIVLWENVQTSNAARKRRDSVGKESIYNSQGSPNRSAKGD